MMLMWWNGEVTGALPSVIESQMKKKSGTKASLEFGAHARNLAENIAQLFDGQGERRGPCRPDATTHRYEGERAQACKN